MVSQATGLDGIIYSKSNNRNSRPWAKASTWPVVIFINNLLLGHSHTHTFTLWLLLPCNAELSSCKKPQVLQSLNYLLSGPFQKGLANPCPRERTDR